MRLRSALLRVAAKAAQVVAQESDRRLLRHIEQHADIGQAIVRQAADPRLNEFLMNVGRRKYLKPLYSEMAKSDDGMARARAIYAKARPRYHAVSTGTIDKILKWNP